jgi:uncharacterized membrane protein YadS
VTDRSPFWKNEDWLAVLVAALLLTGVLLGLLPKLPTFGWAASPELAKIFAASNLARMLAWLLLLLVVMGGAARLSGARIAPFAAGFPVVLALAFVAQFIAGYTPISKLGLEYVIFALLLGLLLSHTLRLPAWLLEAARTELYVKSGLVLLGASVLFPELLASGAVGIAQSLLVVLVVWYFAYWVARKLRVDEEFSVMLATAVSICGVSAAIAACGAIQGDKRKLSYVTSLVLVCAVPMMVGMPHLVRALELSEPVGGAWIGGTLDTSGSVVAASALLGERALKAGVIVKFSQNVLLGLAAFALAFWWTYRGKSGVEKPTGRVIWERFPKFVLGFVAVSLLFSYGLAPSLVKATKADLTALRNTLFSLAFVSIGLETRIGDLLRMEDGRPALAFVIAQSVNVLWTLVLAILLFGGVLFPAPTFS